jgi:hypothetical protein
MQYNPKFLSWCKSYEEEVAKLRELIEGNPADVKQLKAEYKSLTGKAYGKAK